MVSLWGSSKKNGDNQDDQEEQPGATSSQSHGRTSGEATERTRLLPPEPREGYLSPDDPAVGGHECHFIWDGD